MKVIDNPCCCNVHRCSRAASRELSRRSFFADANEGVLFNVESMATFLAAQTEGNSGTSARKTQMRKYKPILSEFPCQPTSKQKPK